MDWIIAIVVFVAFAAYLVKREEPAPKSDDYQGGSRAGRGALWVVFWPAGLWRSIHHGNEKRNQRLIDEIRKSNRP